MGKSMDMVFSHGMRETFTKGTTSKMSVKAMVRCTGLMAVIIKEIGIKATKKDRVYLSLPRNRIHAD